MKPLLFLIAVTLLVLTYIEWQAHRDNRYQYIPQSNFAMDRRTAKLVELKP